MGKKWRKISILTLLIVLIIIIIIIIVLLNLGFSKVEYSYLYIEEENVSNSNLTTQVAICSLETEKDGLVECQKEVEINDKDSFVEGFIPQICADVFFNYDNGRIAGILNNVSLQDLSDYYLNQQNKLNIDTSNLVFIGNSLIEGLRIVSNDSNNFVCKVGVNLDGLKDGYYEKLYGYDCETVIIGMGTNELGYYDEEDFKNSYMDLVAHIRSINLDSIIICLSIPPVSQIKSENNDYFTNQNVYKYNEFVKELCNTEGLYYIDNSLFFGDILASEWTGDGIHLTGSAYKEWYNFIIEEISKL